MSGLRASVDVPGRVRADVAAAPGEVVAVIGPNGSGKSSLLGALAGTVAARGRVEVDGHDWTTVPVHRREVGMVFQDQSLFPHLSARDNVAFGLRARGTRRQPARAAAQQWLDRLGVGALGDRRPSQLSGGQAQRVALARALALDPPLLLLDEPFTGVDVAVATSLRLELATQLRAYEGVSLVVTHDPLDALVLADTIWVLEDGEVVQAGPAAEVAARPQGAHVARLVGLNLVAEGDTWRSFPPQAVTVSLEEPRTSARLRWAGAVRSAVPHGDQVRVLVDTGADGDLLADVTAGSAADLGLAAGRSVHLSVKETSTTTYPAGRSRSGWSH